MMDGEQWEHWEYWDHEALQTAGRAELLEAGREVARRAHALAWQAFLATKDKSDWPDQETNRAAMIQAWVRMDIAVVVLLGAMQAEEEAGHGA
jgi:hypothetical protein